ncbi:citryl-CoA lyase [Acrocarpospora macrocephala]|uniref:citrate synthase (unknown stereospecificity) n=1 Tax=Acrocarpospora macrocephala TaxID=150177 RepID=A0A5M3WFZ6_9ACTN|nr:citrate/2-methylcitrate synthase [Acrocarpospora macrocephala]GES08007.1 citryl-CoA lyase [Acrocarpospora macrocephala]
MTPIPDLSSWSTSITDVKDSSIRYRGVPIEDLIDDGDLATTLWLVLFGGTPGTGSADALRRALIAALDHGVSAPSTLVARVTASTRSAVPFAVAGGLMAFGGPAHGGAAEGAANLFVEIAASDDHETGARDVVRRLLDRGERLPGYGHPYHRRDPRVPGLMGGVAEDRTHRRIARLCEAALRAESGRDLRMNADAAVAALLLDAGLGTADITLVTGLGRAFGLAAHAREELMEEKPFRAPSLDTIRFVSPAKQEEA